MFLKLSLYFFQIVSETFPVVYNTGQPLHKPFSSPGFHTLDPTPHLSRNRPLFHDSIGRSKVYSTIVRLSDTMQEKHAARLQHMSTAKWTQHDYQGPTGDAGSRHMDCKPQSEGFRVGSSDGTLVMPTDQDKLHVPSPVSGKSTSIPVLSLKQYPISFSTVGTVLNGINPKQNSGCLIQSPNDAKPPHSAGKNKATIHGHPRPETVSSSKASVSLTQKKMDFVFISKPMMPSKRGFYSCLSRHGLEKKVWHPAVAQPFHGVVMSPVTDLDGVGTGISLFASRPSSHMNSEGPSMTLNTPNPDPLDDQKECTEHPEWAENDYQQIISIPTADIV